MRVLSDQFRSKGDGYFDGQDDDSQKFIGWDNLITTRLDFFSNQSQDLNYKIIRLANERVLLQDIFKQYNIYFNNTQPSPSGWLPSVLCPFKDHKERTPSFGFNPEQNLFNCFGCHRSGQATHFVAYMNGQTVLEVAKQFLEKNYSLEELLETLDDQNQEKITELLIDFGTQLREFVKRHSEDIKAEEYADSLTWSLDIYLRKNVLSGNINISCLEKIINKIITQFELFGESE